MLFRERETSEKLKLTIKKIVSYTDYVKLRWKVMSAPIVG